MNLLKSWTVNTKEETQSIAAELAERFSAGDVILMQGNLGSGKTFLVQQICKLWQVRDEVTSPTFTLIQNYSGKYIVNHIDLYRIERIEELDQLGWEEMIYSDAVTFIEWPEKVETILRSFYKINIELNNNTRIFKLFKKK